MNEFLIKGGTVITMDPERRRIKNGSVAVKGDKIEAVGRTEDLVKSYSRDSVIDAGGMMIIPGFVNVHHHTQSSTVKMRGVQLETPGGLYDRSDIGHIHICHVYCPVEHRPNRRIAQIW